mmetsp:Transcript_1851/g.2682  ORF Transcript_1851/g.2682 Transcript_1851/m.2682 type:complete len:153 (+) Transcript_1851:108-566(+)|eukprot:CAMPEP_0185269954 /NCGR_PEP_ID=MMETSP1359-20130426/41159_1 /TAXON_ID=552665 /ORGANISM="Bigelowiella longifila, Strain CCMP242" /LENGTH=152 /DNA_ID=CAMNT_0027861345 /DNA_START=72 /DNA_END=530 /DNA_ORIENTATION=+
MGALCRPQDGGDALPDVNREDSASNEKQQELEKKITLKTATTISSEGIDKFPDTEEAKQGENIGFGVEDLDAMDDDKDIDKVDGEKIDLSSKKSTSSSGPRLVTLQDMKKIKISADPATMKCVDNQNDNSDDDDELGFGAEDLDDMPDDDDL